VKDLFKEELVGPPGFLGGIAAPRTRDHRRSGNGVCPQAGILARLDYGPDSALITLLLLKSFLLPQAPNGIIVQLTILLRRLTYRANDLTPPRSPDLHHVELETLT